MTIGMLTLTFQIPLSKSLKDKRSVVKSVISCLHREFNVSVSEVDELDKRDETIIACCMVSNDDIPILQVFSKIQVFISHHFPQLIAVSNHHEFF